MKRALVFALAITLGAAAPALAQWKPVEGRIMTRWAGDVSPDSAWPEHPRPQMVRDQWLNLNGLWDYAVTGEGGDWSEGRVENAEYSPLNGLSVTAPPQWDGAILVPYCIESALSGVGRIVKPEQIIWYRRRFEVPERWTDSRVLLHFQAVDWHSVVFVNGRRVGENKGGYVPFGFDITPALEKTGQQEIVVAVWDPTNIGDQGVGKQSLPERRTGFRFTPTSGIWQTVWLEAVPERSIERLKIVPDVDKKRVLVTVTAAGGPDGEVVVEVIGVGRGRGRPGEPIAVNVPRARLWSPEDPFLYDLRVTYGEDSVKSYFGMRKIEIRRDRRGVARYFLNNKLLRFQYGPLDQGYWPDGILTPASDDAAEFDVQYLKDIGCNMVRPHIKVHPDRWYYHCDRIGLLVWQDMVCTRKFEPKITAESAAQWEDEQRRMIDMLHNHPSVVQWIVFNEGWGQYDTERLTKWTKEHDPTRIVVGASGWTDVAGVGDVRDIHDYSIRPSIPLPESEGERAIVIGEFGGFNVHLEGHLWHPDQRQPTRFDPLREAGRERYDDGDQWLQHYREWLLSWRYLIGEHGLNGGVYTQITDVEHEPNGWLTYDREVSKIPVATLRELHLELYGEPPELGNTVLPGSGTWRYTAAEPAGEWTAADFDDSAWKSGSGPFGGDVRVPAVGTTVGGGQMWLRREFRLSSVPERLAVRARSRGVVDVYINGQLVRGMNNSGPRNEDVGVTIQPIAREAMGAFRRGANVIAVSARVKTGPLFVSVELAEME